MPQLLLEFFSEEIPARMQQSAARDLERMAEERLRLSGLTWEALTTFSGPRRLTLVVEGLPSSTPDRDEEVKGPRTTAPDQALEGFLRKTGLTKEQLVERDGVWLALLSSKGRPTTEVVAEMVDAIVRAFPWPKSMRSGEATLRWVRPLRRILCLFDGHVVPFRIADGSTDSEGRIQGIESGLVTEGHRFMGSRRPFQVSDFSDYRRQLEDNFVLLDLADRKRRILEGARAACQAKGLELVDDDGLLDEVAGLAEWPTPILGEMDPQFLSLPPEVIRLSMKVHQKYFAVRDPASGGLAPNFVVVANVEASDGGMALARGNARVLSARLNDARFFWEEDLKTGFEVWGDKLKGVTFHAKLGTLADRVQRMAGLARRIAPLVGADPDQAELAARLAKVDLASGMVGEFPELQGVMGGYYVNAALDHAARSEIAAAVRDHYKPQGPGDSVPTSPLSIAVALAEKLDTLVGFFAIDEKPTGSKDPFALRRAALGVIRTALDNQLRFSLNAVCAFSAVDIMGLASVSRSWAGAANDPAREGPDEARGVGAEVVAFFADRLKVLLRDQGKRHDLVDAVFALGDDDLVRIVRRLEALDVFLSSDDGANLLAGYKRASNILKAEEKKESLPEGEACAGLSGQPVEEVELIRAVAEAARAVDEALATEAFGAAMTALAGLRKPVDAFFTGVMVNSEVPAERDNRLKLLVRVRSVMNQVADFSLIGG
jgi:glycyl-tRNA synthetase beta chain